MVDSESSKSDLGIILVTGATGQIGRELVNELLQQDYSIVILTRNPKIINILWPNRKIITWVGDLTNPQQLAGIGAGITTVFHLASYAPQPTERDLYNAPGHWNVTAEGTQALLEALKHSNIKCLIYFSSIKAVGDQMGQLGYPADENIDPAPNCLYGRAKLCAEQNILAFGRAFKIKTAILRLPMVYGLQNGGNLARLVRTIASKRFPPWPQLEQRRSAIHVADVIAASLLIARHPASTGQIYFVTDGNTYSTRWIYERTLVNLGKSLPNWNISFKLLQIIAIIAEFIEKNLGMQINFNQTIFNILIKDTWFSSFKIEKNLGFKAQYDLNYFIINFIKNNLNYKIKN